MDKLETAHSVVVVCEAPRDKQTACSLATRTLQEEAPLWFDPDWISWRGLKKSDVFLDWHKVSELARKAGLKPHGHFDGTPGAPYARTARAALLLLEKEGERSFDAVMIVVDTDGEIERGNGLEQARKAVPGIAVIIGLPHPEREAWVLAGFDPRNSDEQKRLDTLKAELKFDPRIHAEKLSATTHGSSRDAKRVCKALGLTDDDDREAACWTETKLDMLKLRGKGTGLAAFLQECERLVPLLTGKGA